MGVGVFFTALIHCALLGFLLLSTGPPAEAAQELVEPEPHPYEVIPIARYGEVLPDQDELPNIVNPADDVRPEDVVTLNDDNQPDTSPLDDRPTRPDPDIDPDQPRDSERHDPNRPTNSEQQQGFSDGSRYGTSLSPTALSNLFAPVQAQIQRAVRPPSTLSETQLEELHGVVSVAVDRDGKITGFRWQVRTGHAQYDAAIERALNLFRYSSRRLHLPANEAAIQQAVSHGFAIRFQGHR